MSDFDALPLRNPIVLSSDEKKDRALLMKVSRDFIDLGGHRVVQGRYRGDKIVTDDFAVVVFAQRGLIGKTRVEHPFNFVPSCGTCGRPVSFDLELSDGQVRGGARKECEFPLDQIVPHKVKIEITSGKIVFNAGFFGGNFDNDDEDRWDPETSLNHTRTRYNFYKREEARGIAYGSVGNTDPGVWFNDELNEFIIGRGAWRDETKEYLAPAEGFRKVGQLITDLWAYTFADHDHLIKLRGSIDPEYNVLEVPNGTWEFTHYADLPDFEDWSENGGPVIFARAKLQ